MSPAVHRTDQEPRTKDQGPTVLLRCDGNAAIGMGHVSRCLALAEALRDRPRCNIVFAMRGTDSAGVRTVRTAGFDVSAIVAGEEIDYGDELYDLVAARDAGAVVIDVRDALTRASLEALRPRGTRIISIDDGTDRRLAADLAFYPPAPQVEELPWSGFTGRRYVGWDWVLLRRDFRGARACEASDAGAAESLARQESESPAIDILVTMGGSDPNGMTEFAIAALDLLSIPFAVRVVVGPAFSRAETLIDAIARSTHAVQIARAPASLAPLMRASRMAVASYGVSAFELAACGVPAVHLCLTDDAARSSSAFEREGAAVSGGVFGRATPLQLADAVRRLMSGAGRRGEMARRARQLVDGRGAERVAALVAAGL